MTPSANIASNSGGKTKRQRNYPAEPHDINDVFD
jgi:hypothetical protein